MRISQLRLFPGEQFHSFADSLQPDLILVFGHQSEIESNTQPLQRIGATFPFATVVGCSTGQFVLNGETYSSGLAITAIELEEGSVSSHGLEVGAAIEVGGQKIASAILEHGKPNGVLLFHDLDMENPEKLIASLRKQFTDKCPISGAVASDNHTLDQTSVYLGSERKSAVAIGIHSPELEFSSASATGLDSCGRILQVTKANGAEVIEIEGMPALDVYKDHIGDEFQNLPLSAWHFPIQLINEDGTPGLIRCPKSIDYRAGTFTCGGNIPKGPIRMLTFTDPEKIIHTAALSATAGIGDNQKLNLFFSCSARLPVLGPFHELEYELALEKLEEDTPSVGFYAYGEICYFPPTGRSELHNQTVTITSFRQRSSIPCRTAAIPCRTAAGILQKGSLS